MVIKAGLFSAVVTAFIIESYKWLQQDNSQAAVDVLSRISTQLGGLTINQVFVNSTEPPLASLPPFIPSPVMVSINVLWFLSLVLNLSAALLGMLAKQWLREYLKWDSVLSPPQENVRLRQLRFQAWNDWGITTKISAIPALLEIALVLFFAGIITFLWTLHQTLAIIVSLTISIFLLIAFIVTIFPAFSHSCPYKSPSGWAVTVLYDRVLRGVKFAVYIIRTLKVHDRLSWPDYKLNWSNYYGKLESWRKRDLHLCA
ncbi:hypothetical protein PHLCEN_2v84 [Hermanssonia centrifuga]|uniref:DUF6535 domain-containing protein n=1 Tax=Hermanssonia centrifuga TaxID=98765 RepID=A0A2R6S723_9APHY|nr:hypothetical protein PHLCEN_2v84 [Hermanssonia centrifuga]